MRHWASQHWELRAPSFFWRHSFGNARRPDRDPASRPEMSSEETAGKKSSAIEIWPTSITFR